jgi:hypothetical protein
MWRSNRAKLRNASQRRLSFEQFESRRLMAVTTSLNNGTLTITGDTDADDVAIVGTANAGEITVTGRNGTLVNGVANGSTTIQGVTADLDADFGNGDNVINMDNVYLAGRLTVETGNGTDSIVFGATGVVSSAGDCRVAPGSSGDVFRAEAYKVFIGGNLFLVGGGTATLTGASALGSITVFAHSEVLMRGITSGGNLEIRAGGTVVNSIAIFTSSASGLSVITPSGQNSIYIDTCYAPAGIVVQAQTSFILPEPSQPTVPPFNINDTITIARCQTSRVTVDTTGARPIYIGGDDTVFIYGNHIVELLSSGLARLEVETGDGNDNVTASYNVVLGDVFASLAQLDDTLTLVGNLVTGFASADGGTGGNRLNLLGNQFGGSAFTQFQ